MYKKGELTFMVSFISEWQHSLLFNVIASASFTALVR